MTISLHDPKLTAYALGELEGEELAEVENAIARSAALREEVDSIRGAAETLREALGREAADEEAPPRFVVLEPVVGNGGFRRGLWFSGALLAAAASLVLASVLSLRNSVEPPEPPQVGELAPPPTAVAPLPGTVVSNPEPAGKEAAPVPTRAAVVLEEPSAKAAQPVVPPNAQAPSRAAVEPAETPPASTTVRAASGRVRGTVFDASGSVVPGVEVSLMQGVAKIADLKVSNERGEFAFDSIPAGPVELRASLEGFRKFSTRFDLQRDEVVVDPVLEIGDVSETVVVSADAPSLSVNAERTLFAGSPQLPANGRLLFSALPAAPPASEPEFNTEAYDRIEESGVQRVADHPLSTFSIDVDTASYSNVRRFLLAGTPPPPDAVRIEELINYFPYDDLPPTGNDPFSVNAEVAPAPWDANRLLLRIALKGRQIAASERPAANLVFLVDVSGSMSPQNKLPLLKSALRLLVAQLQPRDRVAMVVYAGSSGLALPSTPGSDKAAILAALDQLEAGGSTNGGEGIRLAYATAREHFVQGGINRVILATDGDFNVGVTNQGDLTRLIEKMAKEGVFLTVLGFGMGNYKDSTLEKLADKGNGNYGYVDTLREARKLLVEQIDSTLVTIAKDVKIQVEFNPAQVAAYRLIGYENRRLAAEDFNDDRKDAGEIGAGHSVTALYELTPAGSAIEAPAVDPLKYQSPARPAPGRHAHEMLTVKLRYKKPDEDTSRLIERAVVDGGARLENTSDDFRFAAAVACFGMVLRDSPNRGSSSFEMALGLARRALGPDPYGYRSEFVTLAERARSLADR